MDLSERDKFFLATEKPKIFYLQPFFSIKVYIDNVLIRVKVQNFALMGNN